MTREERKAKLAELCSRLEQEREGDLSHLPEDAEHMDAQDLHFAGVFLSLGRSWKASRLMNSACERMGWAR